MAKQKEDLTLEEKLEKALVVEGEQPYTVPDNWVWTRLYSLFSINPKSKILDETEASFIPMTNVDGGLKSNYSFEKKLWKDIKKGYTHFKDNDVVFAKISPCFENRKSAVLSILENGIGAGTTELVVLRQGKMNPWYTFWLVNTENFIHKGKNTFSGTVGQQRVNMDYIRNYAFPLPPLAEQQRIVNRIESLFAKLDSAKELAQNALDTFENRKAAILHKAFTGELTKKWRKENNVSFDSWVDRILLNIGNIVTGGTPSKNNLEYYGGNFPFIKPTELNQGRYVCVASEYLSEQGKSVSRFIRAGSTCICCIGATISKCGFLLVDATTNQQINSIQPFDFMNDLYVYYFASSSSFKNNLIENSSSTTLPIINKSRMSLLKIPVPTLPEQTEIVRILDTIFEKEAQAKELANVIGKIDLMKKAILGRAFRGELGTNNPDEESAKELLASILEKN